MIDFIDELLYHLMPIILPASIVVLIIGYLIRGPLVVLYHPGLGQTKRVRRGFSFSYMFFGPFVPLFRGHIAGFFLSFLSTIISFGLLNFILCFLYNKMYISYLVGLGYIRKDIYQEQQEKENAILAQTQQDTPQEQATSSVHTEPIADDDVSIAIKKGLESTGKVLKQIFSKSESNSHNEPKKHDTNYLDM
ncbi:MAG: hypothetical protein ATN35_04620 [Epulopiscium sp. Nele67-Bin004]|nr:MAG: hypothetical protein ATN35_04620 [Epulopiscium sp. Nele67-Bin004]